MEATKISGRCNNTATGVTLPLPIWEYAVLKNPEIPMEENELVIREN
jgi:hypothetical protein